MVTSVTNPGSSVEHHRLTRHPALGGPERQYLQARLAHRRGDLGRARHLMQQCLHTLPGHPGFLQFATEINAELAR